MCVLLLNNNNIYNNYQRISKTLSNIFLLKVDIKKLKFFVIRNLQGEPLSNDLENDAKKALDKVNID